MRFSPAKAISWLFLLISVFVAVAGIATVLVMDSRGLLRPAAPTMPPTVVKAAIQFTDVPVISAVPPTATPTATLTPSNTPTLTPTETATPIPTIAPSTTASQKPPTKTAAPAASGKPCVSVIGDSVAHGDGVFEIPGTGYVKAQLAPVSAFIQQQYRQRGNTTMQVFNRSASAVGISSPNHPSFFNTVEYAQLLQDRCQYAVIVPWLNDLSSGQDPSVSAAQHIQAMSALIRALQGSAPKITILVVYYYNGGAAPFALQTFASGMTPATVAAFNQQLAGACSSGAFSAQVKCVDANAIFADMGLNYVLGWMTKPAFDSVVTAPVTDGANLVNAYFGANPGGSLMGDGVHLSNMGKARLAERLVAMMP